MNQQQSECSETKPGLTSRLCMWWKLPGLDLLRTFLLPPQITHCRRVYKSIRSSRLVWYPAYKIHEQHELPINRSCLYCWHGISKKAVRVRPANWRTGYDLKFAMFQWGCGWSKKRWRASHNLLPSGELTYHTKRVKENHLQSALGWNMLVPRRVFLIA